MQNPILLKTDSSGYKIDGKNCGNLDRRQIKDKKKRVHIEDNIFGLLSQKNVHFDFQTKELIYYLIDEKGNQRKVIDDSVYDSIVKCYKHYLLDQIDPISKHKYWNSLNEI